MKKIYTIATVSIFVLFLFTPFVRAEETTNTSLLLKGTILNADGSLYNKNVSASVSFTPLSNSGKVNTWEGNFSLLTPGALDYILKLGKHAFSSAAYTWLKIQPVQYRAVAMPYNDVAVGSSAATQDIESEAKVVDLRTAQGTVDLQFQFLTPHKFITGTIVDDLGTPIAGTYDAKNRIYNVRAAIRVAESPALYSFYRDYSVMPDENGKFTIAVAHRGGYYSIFPFSDTADKYLRNIGHQAEGAFQDDTAEETVSVTLRLTRAGTSVIRGKMVDSFGKPFGSLIVNGKPTQSAAVYADVVDKKIGQFMNIGADGLFSMKVPAGDYRVSLFAQKSGAGGGGEYITYPTLSVNIQDGQTIDLGNIQPSHFVENDPRSTTSPKVVEISGGTALFSQTKNTIKSVTYIENFHSEKYYNAKASNGVQWATDGVSLKSATSAVTAQAVSSALVNGTVVSKSFGPQGGKITKAKLFEYHQATGTGSIQYHISADGVHWLEIIPGTVLDIPAHWNTKNGLKWKATLQKSNSADAVSLKALKIEMTTRASIKKPSISSINVVANRSESKVSMKGKNLTSTPTVYVGAVKATGVQVKNGVLTFTVKRKSIPKSAYTITVITPDLQSAVKTKVNLRSTTK